MFGDWRVAFVHFLVQIYDRHRIEGKERTPKKNEQMQLLLVFGCH